MTGDRQTEMAACASPDTLDSRFAQQIDDGEPTLAEYIRAHFLPEHVALKSNPGRRHYHAILKHVIRPWEVEQTVGSAKRSRPKLTEDPTWPYLGTFSMHRISPADVQNLIEAAVQKGYSVQTVRHVRNVVRSVFAHATRCGAYAGVNPAAAVSIPEGDAGSLHTLTLTQTIQVLERMSYPEREVALMAILTSMTISEICGLQWKSVNLADHPLTREGVQIPPRHIAIRTQRYRGELAAVPRSRKKYIPIPPLLHRVLRNLAKEFPAGWEDFVLTTRSGHPVNQVNLAVRRLKRIGSQLDMPWLSWQVFRRTRQSILREYEVRVQDRLSNAMFPRILPIRLAPDRSQGHEVT